ncbi:hypothetical protein [Streptomyces sp. SID3343]|uniref:hypothetical protein n=1 Tax=Streptomyces sp. SID3343 TaxID=2690260 RepID=UPI00136E5F1C|nr:hypothetical protein [Streptomyces sp. SID3343]MYW05542.1 hypothetical protein [Streptomyces sp. SID3343]
MVRNIRIAAPMLYAAAIVLGFLIDTRVGVGVAIVGGMLVGLTYTLLRPAGDGPGRRRRRR